MLSILLLAGAVSVMQMTEPLPATAEQCKISPARQEAMMALGYDAFDQTPSGDNWRSVMNAGCYETAAKLIVAYLNRHKAELDDEKTRTLYFHVGQTLALGRADAASAIYFEQSRGGNEEWNTYVEATIEFIRHDSGKFEAARKHYGEVAPTSPRRPVLDKLSACFDKPYRDAVMCPAKSSR